MGQTDPARKRALYGSTGYPFYVGALEYIKILRTLFAAAAT
jgi:hypothetical protein